MSAAKASLSCEPACREFGNALDTLRSLLTVQNLDLEICVAYDTSLDFEEDLAAFRRLERSVASGSFKIVRLNFSGGASALANLGVKETKADYIAFARAGVIFESEFLQSAIAALDANPSYSFVVAQVSREAPYFSDTDVHLVYGELLNSLFLGRNMLGNLEFVGRRDQITKLPFDEYLDREIAWDFFIRAAIAGDRSIVSNRVDAVSHPSNHDGRARHFRSHPDSIFVKHGLDTPTFAQFRLVSAHDALPQPRPDHSHEEEWFKSERVNRTYIKEYLARYEQLRGPGGLAIRAAFRVLMSLLDVAIGIGSLLSFPHSRLIETKRHIWNHQYEKVWPTLSGR